MRTRIKICGFRRPQDVEAAVEAGVDALGFVMEPKSKRFIEPEKVRELCRVAPAFVSKVGVYWKAFPGIQAQALAAGMDILQVHGPCERGEERIPFIRAISFGEDIPEHEDFDMLMLDNSEPGSGRKWDRSLAVSVSGKRRIIIAGGLSPDNVYDAVKLVKPYAVDVSTGVEVEGPGIKDAKLMNEFVKQVRRADMEA